MYIYIAMEYLYTILHRIMIIFILTAFLYSLLYYFLSFRRVSVGFRRNELWHRRFLSVERKTYMSQWGYFDT